MFLDRVGSGTLSGARIFFPDPWPKVRQHHRRIVSADVVRALIDRLRIGGTLHLATDISDYAEVMQRVCDAEPQLEGGVIDRPDWRPLTRFEQRGLDEARDSVDLLYRRVELTAELEGSFDGFGGDVRRHGEVAHLATRPGDVLAVEVELGSGFVEHHVPRRLAGGPHVAEQIDHRNTLRRHRRAPQPDPAHRSDLLLVLARHARIESPVTAVVGARGQLVDEQLDVARRVHASAPPTTNISTARTPT